MHFAKDIKNWEIEKIIKPLINANKNRPVFITFDIDGFDSSLMQATGTPEPGGMFWYDAINIIKEASKVSKIVGADVVDVIAVCVCCC